MQSSIPAVFMRGGTSRGLYFKKADLPDNRDLWDDILLKAFGSPDPRQVDGVGGTTSVTSKSCILSPSERDDCDIDYLFAQLAVDEAKVDYAPTCGNMLAGVGPYAIETGMIQAQDGETRVRIHQVNTGGLVEAVVPTPGGKVEFEGEFAIDGVPGTAAPILLNFMNVIGARTGKLFPTDEKTETIDGVDVTVIEDADGHLRNIHVSPGGIKAIDRRIPADASSALYWASLATIILGSRIELIGLDPTDGQPDHQASQKVS